MAKGLIEFHEKSKSYDWDFTVGDKSPKYETKYAIPAKARDPFRMLIRGYMKMEAEKDDRTYGFLEGTSGWGWQRKLIRASTNALSYRCRTRLMPSSRLLRLAAASS